jgi:hypothetical protein
MLGRHTLARMKNKENTVGQKRKKIKVDKKDDITIVLFFLFYFSDYIVRTFTIKNVGLWFIMEVPNIFWGKESSQY